MPIQTQLLSRRRMITVLAGASAAPMVPKLVGAEVPGRWVWRGTALGASAMLILEHPDRRAAEVAISACLEEIERLEAEFSLHRPGSALSRLNEGGWLAWPSLDMLALLETASAMSAASGGAFDITVQPLWRLYARHFAGNSRATVGPPDGAIARALERVDYHQLSLAPDRITMSAGMSVTMNGIAQGYITDRVAALLRTRGWESVMIDLGEIHALGTRADGRPWTVGIDQPAVLRDALPVLNIQDRAVATSSAAGTTFDETGRYHHLFDPRTGRSAHSCAQVTVVADRATLADGLSTALFIAEPEERGAILRLFPRAECLIVERDGRLTRLVG